MSYLRILFCATGVERTVGGIASANRNVRAALSALASERGGQLEMLVLNETEPNAPSYRVFSGGKLRFSIAAGAAMLRARLVVFDHVRLALPLLAIPEALRPVVMICAHGSEAWRCVKPSSIRLFRAADLVLANSTYTLNRMRGRFNGFAGLACPLGLPPQHDAIATHVVDGPLSLCAADGVERTLGARMLLLVGRLDAREREKGHRELIAALPHVAEAFSDVQLVFVGGGSDEPEIRRIAAASPEAVRIFVTGQVENAALNRLYHAAYAYVMPSRQEGFGLVYLEAMKAAKPCVACRDDGGAEVVVDGETGYLVDQPIVQDQLVNTLTRLLGDPEAAHCMGLAGEERLLRRFSAEAYQARLRAHAAALLDGELPACRATG